MKTAGICSDSVKARTGRGWDEWFAILDAAGAVELPHKEIAVLLHREHGIAAWWAQSVTVGYEQARGLRQVHQQPGGFTANISRTLPYSAEAVYDAFTNARRRNRWLCLALKITTSTPLKSVRIAAADGTRVDVNIYPKGPSKTTIQLQHEKLASADEVQRMKIYWAGAFDALKSHLAQKPSPA
ncbi:MAG: DUF4287 domain-containing protein [Bryobacteraceae bacterium]|nr:DUF4287 domain-containing protein [Bryobacteraceae bacterium]